MKKFIAASVIVFVFLTVAIVQAMEKEPVSATNEDNLPGLKVGVKAPDFTLKDLNGNIVKLSDYQGKKVMLNFWATWCPPCKAEMPDMEKFRAEAGDDIHILAVNIDPKADVQGFANKIGVTFPILLDMNDQVNTVYQILTIPTTYFIDEQGIIRHKYLSAMPIDVMRQYTKEM